MAAPFNLDAMNVPSPKWCTTKSHNHFCYFS